MPDEDMFPAEASEEEVDVDEKDLGEDEEDEEEEGYSPFEEVGM